jgi:hypothetical protein
VRLARIPAQGEAMELTSLVGLRPSVLSDAEYWVTCLDRAGIREFSLFQQALQGVSAGGRSACHCLAEL